MSLTVTVNEKLIEHYSKGRLDAIKRGKISACYEKIINSTSGEEKLCYMDKYCAFLEGRRMEKLLGAEAETFFCAAERANDALYMAAAKDYSALAHIRMNKRVEGDRFLAEARKAFETLDIDGLSGDRRTRALEGKAHVLYMSGAMLKPEEINGETIKPFEQSFSIYDGLVHGADRRKHMIHYVACANDLSVAYWRMQRTDKYKETLKKVYPDISAYCREEKIDFNEMRMHNMICKNLANSLYIDGDKDGAYKLFNEALELSRTGYKKYPLMMDGVYGRLLQNMIRLAENDGKTEMKNELDNELKAFELDIRKQRSYKPSGDDYRKMSQGEINLIGSMDSTPDEGVIIV